MVSDEAVHCSVRKAPFGRGIMVVDVVGELLDEEAVAGLDALIRDLISQGRRRIILNLEETTFITTRGIGAITEAQKRLRDRGGELKIAGARGDVWRVIEMVWLHRMVECYGDVNEAARSF